MTQRSVEPGPDDVLAAADRIADAVVRTPTLLSATLSSAVGAEVYLKFENLQFTASFKERGARNKLLTLDAAQCRNGVIAMSAGNHGQGVARHAGLLGIPATIVMPEGTPFTEVDLTERLGADVIVSGSNLAEAASEAHRIERDRDLAFIHPFDDSAVIAGQGTVALEMLTDVGALDAILVPVGGGGLLAGMALGAVALGQHPRLIGVQTDTDSSMADLMAQRRPQPGSEPTLAEGIAVSEPGQITRRLISRYVEKVVTVAERHIEDAIAMLVDIEKTVVEGAGAVGLAALLSDPELLAGLRVGVVLTGGNIDSRVLANVLTRKLVRDGRMTALRIQLTDRPGRLAVVTRVLGDAGANVVELSHHRLAGHVAATAAELDVVIETRSRDHTDEVIGALRAANITVVVSSDASTL